MSSRYLRALVLVLVPIVSMLGLLWSPVAMQWYGRYLSLDWLLLSNIGQAYGFAAALLSAVALVALALSLRRQTAEITAQRLEAFRGTHMQLILAALDDPDLLACFPMARAEVPARKRYHYINLFVQWWHYLYNAGVIPEDQVRYEVAYILRGEAAREYVVQHRDTAPPVVMNSRFFQIVDDELDKALASGPPVPYAFRDDERQQPAPHSTHRSASVAGGVALCIALGWVAGSAARRRAAGRSRVQGMR